MYNTNLVIEYDIIYVSHLKSENYRNHYLVARRFLAYIVTQSSEIGSSFALNDFNVTLSQSLSNQSGTSTEWWIGTHVNVFGI